MERFVIVTFPESNEVSVVPQIWLLSSGECYWPKSSAITSLVKRCAPPKPNWSKLKIKLYTTKEGDICSYDNYNSAENHVQVVLEESSDMSSQASGDEQVNESSSATSELPDVMEYILDNENELDTTLKDGTNATLTPLQPLSHISERSTRLQTGCHGCQTILEEKILPVLNELVTIVTRLEADNKELNILLKSRNANEGIENDENMPRMPAETVAEFLLLEEYSKIPHQANSMIRYLSGTGGLNCGNATRRVWAALVTDQLSNQLSWIGANGKFKLQDLNIIRIVVVAVKKLIPTATELDVLSATKVWIRKAAERIKKSI